MGISFAGDNNGQKITVFARIKVKPAEAERASHPLKKVLPQTRESGCINYDMHDGVGTEPSDYKTRETRYFMFYENWRSRTDWDKHMKMPYLKKWAALCNEKSVPNRRKSLSGR